MSMIWYVVSVSSNRWVTISRNRFDCVADIWEASKFNSLEEIFEHLDPTFEERIVLRIEMRNGELTSEKVSREELIEARNSWIRGPIRKIIQRYKNLGYDEVDILDLFSKEMGK